MAVAAAMCSPWCERAACSHLNGANIEGECGGCPETHACWRGAKGFNKSQPSLSRVGPAPGIDTNTTLQRVAFLYTGQARAALLSLRTLSSSGAAMLTSRI